jgi:predicted KAP-like P-loop ATPase
MFSSDKPINKISEDILGRSNFSKELAKAIVNADSKESLIVALNGTWGSGKSSVINMVEDECKNIYQNKIKVVRFNPWYYSDRSNLILKYFECICAEEKIFDNIKKRKKVFEKIGNYAANFESVSSFIPYASGGVKAIKNASEQIKKKYESKLVNIEEQQKEIRKIFSTLEYKILIIIDDIDRLTQKEIRDIFQLVKLVADIPNMVYLLSFDREVVRSALDEFHKGKGEDYLEKIVQVQFELPQLSQKEYDKYLFKKIDEIIKDIPQSDFEQDRWIKIYNKSFKHLFRTLRHVNRYINTLSFDFHLVKNEVNIVDLLGITAVKVFNPWLYDTIRNNINMFLNVSTKSSGFDEIFLNKDDNKYKNEFLLLIDDSKLDKATKNLLVVLFPKTRKAIGDGFYSSVDESASRRKQRISNEDCFEIYFMFKIPQGFITNNEMKIVMDDKDENSFKIKLNTLNKENKISDFLNRLEDFTNEIPLNEIQKFINTFMSIGDSFVDKNEGGFFTGYFFQNSFKILRITFQLLIRIESKKERFEILKKAFKQDNISLGTVVTEITSNDSQHKRFGRNDQNVSEEKILLDEKDLDELELIGKSLIEKSSKNGELLYNKEFLSILYRWEEWGGEKELKEFIKNNCISIDKISILLLKFISRVSVQDGDGHETSHHYTMQFDSVKKFIDVDLVYSKLKDFNEKEYEEYLYEQKEAIRLFKVNYEGKNEFR